MTNLELALIMLAKTLATEISKKKKPEGLSQNKVITK